MFEDYLRCCDNLALTNISYAYFQHSISIGRYSIIDTMFMSSSSLRLT